MTTNPLGDSNLSKDSPAIIGNFKLAALTLDFDTETKPENLFCYDKNDL